MSSTKNNPTNERGAAECRDVDRILYIRLPVTAVLARKRVKMADVLTFRVGTVLEFDANNLIHNNAVSFTIKGGKVVIVGMSKT